MPKAKNIPFSQNDLQRIFDYTNGTLIWRENRGNNKVKGRVAGYHNQHGYILIALNNVRYRAHRLAWVYVYGSIPNHLDIDHINGVRDDNRVENLRLVTVQQNMMNNTVARGYRYRAKNNNYEAFLGVDGRRVYLGVFPTAHQARRAYLEAKQIYHVI